MKKIITILTLLSILVAAHAQSPTWATEIAPIIYKNCAKCHNPNGVAPFALLTYADAYNNRFGIKYAVNSKSMPPWSPDPNYSHFANERVLSPADIEALNKWVNADSPSGDLSKAPVPPSFGSGSEIQNPDMIITIPAYTVNTGADLYRCFTIPTNLPTDRFITELEIIPGNRSIVHHVLAFQDISDKVLQLDAADPLPGYTNYGGTGSSTSDLIYGWVPGQGKVKFPNGMAMRLLTNTNIVLQIHYPGGIVNKIDSTKIVLKFGPTSNSYRELTNKPILAHVAPILTNGPLEIKKNTTRSFTERINNLPADISVLSVAPHMHLIGRRAKAYGILPNKDTLKLINIPDWDFNWQGAYSFRNPIKAPKGMSLVGEAFYDNTTANPFNPSNPPQDVKLGEGTTDEMMLFYFTYTPYQTGDEKIVVDSNAIVKVDDELQQKEKVTLHCAPNPTKSQTVVTFHLPESEFCNIDIFNMNGEGIKNVTRGEKFLAGENKITLATSDIPVGSYFIRISSEKYYGIDKLVKID